MPLCSTPVVPLASYFAFIFCWHFSTSVDKIFLLYYRDTAKLWREAVNTKKLMKNMKEIFPTAIDKLYNGLKC